MIKDEVRGLLCRHHYRDTMLDDGTVKVDLDFQGIADELNATQGRGMCRFKWSLADNGWASHTCSECGFTQNADVHVQLGWNYCPNCGRKIITI